jgi:hypothetical protein
MALKSRKPFGHIEFDLVAGFSQVREVPVVSFLSPGLVAIRAVGDAVGGDGVEQVVVQAQAARRVVFALQRDHRLKRFQGLDGALEADRTWFEIVLVRCLSDDRANQVVGQDVCPQFLANQFGSLAAQHVHLHGLFEGSQIELSVPIILPPKDNPFIELAVLRQQAFWAGSFGKFRRGQCQRVRLRPAAWGVAETAET